MSTSTTRPFAAEIAHEVHVDGWRFRADRSLHCRRGGEFRPANRHRYSRPMCSGRCVWDGEYGDSSRKDGRIRRRRRYFHESSWLKRKTNAASEQLDIRFEEGDAEELPFPDQSFDVVLSMFGAMFAPRPQKVAAELLRVCKPGGVIAMANWTPQGFVGKSFLISSSMVPPPPVPPPVLWGDEAVVRERLGARRKRDHLHPAECERWPIRSPRRKRWSFSGSTLARRKSRFPAR